MDNRNARKVPTNIERCGKKILLSPHWNASIRFRVWKSTHCGRFAPRWDALSPFHIMNNSGTWGNLTSNLVSYTLVIVAVYELKNIQILHGWKWKINLFSSSFINCPSCSPLSNLNFKPTRFCGFNCVWNKSTLY